MKESNRIELKRELTDSLEKEVVAFLNYREGGHIYIGIEGATGTVVGVFDGGQTTLTDQATDQATMQAEKVLKFCIESRSRSEIQAFLGLKNRDYFRKEILDKPKGPKQRYITRNKHKVDE